MKTEILALRLVVGYLGEKSQFGWWQSSFFAPTSSQFLLPSFPRTLLLSQYNGVVEAARRMHDEHIGIGRVFHLFRLPAEIEQDLHQTLLYGLSKHNELLSSHDSACTYLATLAQEQPIPAKQGPVAIGKITDLLEENTVKKIAAIYLGAFNCTAKTYPYFVTQS